MSYKIIDPLIAAIIGSLVAITAAKVVPADSNMLLGMLLGGICGIALQIVLMFPLMILFGAFEIMIPFALIAMPVGMMSGMTKAWFNVSISKFTWAGAIFGLFVAIFIYFSNRKIRTQL